MRTQSSPGELQNLTSALAGPWHPYGFGLDGSFGACTSQRCQSCCRQGESCQDLLGLRHHKNHINFIYTYIVILSVYDLCNQLLSHVEAQVLASNVHRLYGIDHDDGHILPEWSTITAHIDALNVPAAIEPYFTLKSKGIQNEFKMDLRLLLSFSQRLLLVTGHVARGARPWR